MYVDDDESEGEDPLAGFWLEGDSLAPPCQADLDVVNEILDIAAPYLTSSDKVLYDLGCGDGRICTEAAKRFGCRSVGCEIEEHLIERFKHNVEALSLVDRVTIVHGDLCDLELNGANVIVIYLLPESVLLIKDKMTDVLRAGGVIICNTWGLKGLDYKTKQTCGKSKSCDLFLYDRSCLPN